MDNQKDKCQQCKEHITLQHFQAENEPLQRLIFCEHLEVSKESLFDSTLGQFSVHVELKGRSLEDQPQHFQVHVSGKAVLGQSATNKVTLTSNFTTDLMLIEETWSEFKQIKTEDQQDIYETHLYLGRGKRCYYTSTRSYKNGIIIAEQKNEIKLKHAKNLVSEGINIVLLRIMALNNFLGRVKFKRILRNGQPASCVYEVEELMNGEESEIIVCQTIKDKTNFKQTFKSVLTTMGRLVKHEWCGSGYFMRMIPNCPVEKHGTCRQFPIVPLDLQWQHDMELVSKHQDNKTCQLASYRSYLDDNPNAKYILADFIQAVFLLKPTHNIIEFATAHFNTCTHNPEDELKEAQQETEQAEGTKSFTETSCATNNSEDNTEEKYGTAEEEDEKKKGFLARYHTENRLLSY